MQLPKLTCHGLTRCELDRFFHHCTCKLTKPCLIICLQILIFLPEHLARKWQYHSVGRLMSKLLHPGNSWKLLKREAMRLFLLWYQILGEVAGEPLHAMFATLVPGFPSPYQGLGLTALAAMTPDTQVRRAKPNTTYVLSMS